MVQRWFLSRPAKQQENLRQAVEQYIREKKAGRKQDDSGRYIDYYTCLGLLGDRAILAGTSFSRQAMNKTILFSALIYTLNTVFLELLLIPDVDPSAIQPHAFVLSTLFIY